VRNHTEAIDCALHSQ